MDKISFVRKYVYAGRLTIDRRTYVELLYMIILINNRACRRKIDRWRGEKGTRFGGSSREKSLFKTPHDVAVSRSATPRAVRRTPDLHT